MSSATNCLWDGLQAVKLQAADYEALIIPSLGANVISLQYREKDSCKIDVLRTPKNAQALRDDPYAYGIPVLFPANRVQDSYFTHKEITYNFPANYPNNVHIHGVLHNYSGWSTVQLTQTPDEAVVCFEATTQDKILRDCFPVDLIFRLQCTLSKHGLLQRFTLVNQSEFEVPFGLAYHTAFKLPFCTDSIKENVRLHVPLATRCLDDEIDRLPNGKSGALTEFEKQISKIEGAYPLKEPLDYLYDAVPKTTDSVLYDISTGKQIVYRAGSDNNYWIIWNSNADKDFVAVEPQTWLSNAMHLKNPQQYGAIFVPAHSQKSSDTTIFVR